jgi:NADPH:quinone reductase-like Zn-dependent oxidoreductase
MLPETMKAAAIDRFGGPEVIHTQTLPLPQLGEREVLIQVDIAGVGSWEPELVSGALGDWDPIFPRVFGSDGSGTVIACGEKVKEFSPGDRVYGWGFENRKGGFFAEYVALPEDRVAPIPSGLSIEEAGALAVDGLTALEGLDVLKLDEDDAVLIIGASGGAGHLACQLAHRRGLQVFAVASGPDGVALAKRLGCEGAADGRGTDVVERAKEIAPDGYDGALVFAGAEDRWESVLALLKKRSRVAYPNGVQPAPKVPHGVKAKAYDGVATQKMFQRLNHLIESDGVPFHVELSRVYGLDDAGLALRDVAQHHLGKLAVRVR